MKLPGLIDPHVHLRDPGQTHKEDFLSGTRAALAGGFTFVGDMPNNPMPITTEDRLDEKRRLASKSVVSDIGFHFGTLGDNFDQFDKVIDKVLGLKVYMNVTTGNFKIDADKLLDIYEAWPNSKPILLHAEDDVSSAVLGALSRTHKRTHICHVSSAEELKFVIRCKEGGLPITCGVTPHHLFLTDQDTPRLGPFGRMKPYLKSVKDVKFLWEHIDAVDIIESDHAPHTKEEKLGADPPFGVPGLETTLPLMLTAQQSGRISQAKLVGLLHDKASEIFALPGQDDTSVLVSLEEYVISPEVLNSKAGWTPFEGMNVIGRVKEVVLRGSSVYKDGKILAYPGSGRILP